MLESQNMKTTSPKQSRDCSSFDTHRKNSSNNLPSILKKKFSKRVYSPSSKKKLKKDVDSGKDENYVCGRIKLNSTSDSNSFFNCKRSFITSNVNDFFKKEEIERLKFYNAARKKHKRVRFSDVNDIIGPNYCKSITVPSEPLPKEEHKADPSSLISENILDKFNLFNVLSNFKDIQKQNVSNCYDAKSFETYTHLKTILENFEKTIAPLTNDESMKKFKFNCQKAVTIPVNAISPVSASHLLDKYTKLHQLLDGKTVEVGDIKITASQHPLGIQFCKNLLAKKFMRQGDLTVSSKPDAAFSLAAVLVSLWVDFPDFGQLVLAHFYSACPYLLPVFIPQVEGQSDEDYYKCLGYHYSQNGEVEKQDSFLKRMSGIMRLYAALIISKPRQHGKINPLGLAEGWRWLSAMLNLEPRPDICATLLYDFLEVAGNEMFKVYGAQFKKVLAYICQEYFPKLEKITPPTAGGPIVRLEGFLEKVLKEETIPPPQGILPPNFW